MRRRLAAAVALALAILVCLPAGVGAKPRGDAPSARQLIRIELEGSNGYSILVTSDPRQHLTLLATKEGAAGEPAFTTEYTTKDTLPSPDRVKAKLRGVGSISVRFHPRGPVRHPSPPGCEGRHPTVQPGVVRGAIKFVGESEYTRVEAHEAKAELEEPTSWLCRPGAELELSGRRTREEWVSKLSVGEIGTYFIARKYKPGVLAGGRVLFFAERGVAFETELGHVPLTIRSRTTVVAPTSTFLDAHPEHVVVSPPSPFTGTATFARTPESVFAWNGDLSVQLPAFDPTPLVGPEFEPDYCLREVGCIRQHVEDHSFSRHR